MSDLAPRALTRHDHDSMRRIEKIQHHLKELQFWVQIPLSSLDAEACLTGYYVDDLDRLADIYAQASAVYDRLCELENEWCDQQLEQAP